jgi:cytosine/adenosine deaminase-related metal-dependent hydrolase
MELDQALTILEQLPRPELPQPLHQEELTIRDVLLPAPHAGPVDVAIADGVIAAIEPSKGNGSGGFLTPGLIDMHTHLPSDNALVLSGHFMQLYLAHGVTTIRDTGDMDGTGVRAARAALDRAGWHGPRIITAGAFVGGPGPQRWSNTKLVATGADADRVVTELIGEGSGLVKAYEGLDRPSIRALVDAASRRGLHVIGHVPHELAYEDALIPEPQHYFGVPPPEELTCTSVLCRGGDWAAVDADRLHDIVDVTLEHDLGNTPTLVQNASLLRYRHPGSNAGDPTVQLLPPHYVDVVWHPEIGIPVYRELPPGRLDALDDALSKKARLTKLLFDAGALLHPGTDVQQPFVVPGASLHQEMQLFAQAGIPIAAVWELATVAAARQLGVPGDGRIIVGAAADLLVHSNDPTHSTNPLRTLRATVAGGQLFTQEALWESVRRHQAFHRRPDVSAASAVLAAFAMRHASFTD